MMQGSYFDGANARAALESIRRLREQIAERRAPSADIVSGALDAFDKRLVDLVGAPAPGGGRGGGRGAGPAQSPDSLEAVVATLGGLARELGAADVQPTAEQVKTAAAARAAARRAMLRWQSLRTTELTALNAALAKAGLEPIKLQ
jgi:hypothetical protein